jgi:hypothetical protein
MGGYCKGGKFKKHYARNWRLWKPPKSFLKLGWSPFSSTTVTPIHPVEFTIAERVPSIIAVRTSPLKSGFTSNTCTQIIFITSKFSRTLTPGTCAAICQDIFEAHLVFLLIRHKAKLKSNRLEMRIIPLMTEFGCSDGPGIRCAPRCGRFHTKDRPLLDLYQIS